MDQQTAKALREFTQRYFQAWQQQRGTLPESEALYDVPSPCIVSSTNCSVFWQSQLFSEVSTMQAVERALGIVVQQPLHTYYTTQFAGDMQAIFGEREMTLLQVWSEDDFRRVQENLIGHLITQKRLKLTPTLFVATLDSELEVISVCNLSGEVLIETLGTPQRKVLSPSLASFLSHLNPLL